MRRFRLRLQRWPLLWLLVVAILLVIMFVLPTWITANYWFQLVVALTAPFAQYWTTVWDERRGSRCRAELQHLARDVQGAEAAEHD